MQLMTYQIEHEVLHAVIHAMEGYHAGYTFDSMAWAITGKVGFLKLQLLARKMGYRYIGKCKYLDGE